MQIDPKKSISKMDFQNRFSKNEILCFFRCCVALYYSSYISGQRNIPKTNRFSNPFDFEKIRSQKIHFKNGFRAVSTIFPGIFTFRPKIHFLDGKSIFRIDGSAESISADRSIFGGSADRRIDNLHSLQ